MSKEQLLDLMANLSGAMTETVKAEAEQRVDASFEHMCNAESLLQRALESVKEERMALAKRNWS